MAKKKADELIKEEVVASEGLLVGCFWNDPELYGLYNDEQLNNKTFANKEYGFYFVLGRKMFDKGLRSFDDISVENAVEEMSVRKYYEKYGEYETIEDLMNETEDKSENFDGYYTEVMKYNLLRGLHSLLGDQVLDCSGKYDYKKMNAEMLQTYWLDKFNTISISAGNNNIKEGDLLDITEKDIIEWDETPDVGLPFYKSRHLTNATVGWDYGQIYIHGAFSGKGKTALTVAKIVLACINEKEKLLIIANEQSIKEFKKILLITIMGNITKKKFDRKRINQGGFTEEERESLIEAKDAIKEMTEGDSSLIKFVYLEQFTMEETKKVVRRYANRGYKRLIIDTGKPSDGGGNTPRWERFSDDFRELYKLVKPEGLNLACWVNVQLADSAITQRFLNEFALGESKKIKNEASVVILGRSVWADEYEGEKNELNCYKFIKDDFNGGYTKKEFALRREDGQYYLIFIPKNRRGQSNDTGLDVLVLRPNFNNNTWYEVGWCDNVMDLKDY